MKPLQHLRARLTNSLGVLPETKAQIYGDVSQSATIVDALYWLQIFFSAGIATLGLVLNSPAVIIGAMLISPLMGPILSGGLALSAGDLVLGIRAVGNLLLSCTIAIGVAALLIWILPFKEVTTEIAARTQPNTLDLLIALFSGAIGSVSICKQSKGVVTSIPGVAIAVALMPPLCVVGFGLGMAVSISGAEGGSIAKGGALLFMTNLVAITFTATVVFAILQINAAEVKKQMRPWLQGDPESLRVRAILQKLPALGRFKWFQSLPARVAFGAAALVILAIPLSKSYIQLKQEFFRKRQESKILHLANQLCEQKLPGKNPGQRCYVGHLAVSGQDTPLVSLRLFTRKALSMDEKKQFMKEVSGLLQRPVSPHTLQLVEVPTTSGDLAAQEVKEQGKAPAILTVAELETNLLRAVDNSLQGILMPPPAELVDYTVSNSSSGTMLVSMNYLSDHDIGTDAQALLNTEIQSKLNFPQAVVEFVRIPSDFGSVDWPMSNASVSQRQRNLLDSAGRQMRQHAALNLALHADQRNTETPEESQKREQAILDYLNEKWKVDPRRIEFTHAKSTGPKSSISVRFFKSSSSGR